MQSSARVAVLIVFCCLFVAAFMKVKPEPKQDLGGFEPQTRSVSPYRAPRGYVCYRAKDPIRVDGKLDEPAWQQASWTEDFVDIEGDLKPKPRYRSRAKMLWDDQYFYVAAELTEPHVWGTLKEHDSVIFNDNDFEVFIDPNGDSHEYYEFEMNVLNTGWDLLLPRPYKAGGQAVNGWEIPGLKTAVAIDGTLNDPRDTDRGWSVELAFPWKALGELAYQPSPPDDGDQWRVDFSRVEWQHEILDGHYRRVPNTKEDNWVWSPQGVVDMHRPETWGVVQFSTGAPDTVAFQPDSAGATRQILHEVYYAQLDYRKKYGHWAATVNRLGFLPDSKGLDSVQLSIAQELFQATIPFVRPDGKRENWHIRQDSKVWKN